MPGPRRTPRRPASSRCRRVPLVAAALLQVVTVLVAVGVLLHDEPRSVPSAAPVSARAVPGADAALPPALAAAARGGQEQVSRRAVAVEALLAARESALRSGDREAFLAGVDPGSPELRRREAQAFEALRSVPLASWTYRLDPGSSSPPDDRLDRRYGRGTWWAPRVTLSYALDGFDERPVVLDLHLTFRSRGSGWYLAADDDFALQGRPTPRGFWDRGPVVAVRAPGVLVLGRPGAEGLLQEVAAVTAAAVPRVTAVWGPWAERVVVLVPRDEQEMGSLLGGADLSRIAAVATAELRGGKDSYDPTGQRVLVNPDAFHDLGQLARRVVLTHEVTHVAARAASGPAVPGWLAEGFADHVAYSDEGLSPRTVARRLAEEVRAGRVPEALPSDREFDGGSPRLTQAYESAWLAVRVLARQHGDEGLLRLYRSVGAAREVSAEQAVERSLQRELGTTTAQLTADWRAALVQQLG